MNGCSPVSPKLDNDVLGLSDDGSEGGGDSELTDLEDVFIGEEAELPKKVSCDPRPSKEEVALHNTSHLPYRSWCPHCVRGKARRRNHRKRLREKSGGVPVISMDYMWLKGKKEEGENASNGNPILVMHCRGTKLAWSRMLLKK